MTLELDFDARLASFGSTRYRDLRPSQRLALRGYAAHRSARDVAAELPTGYGKTLVALLVADLALEEGSTVAYLTGNNQLTDQVIEQAGALPGLDVVKFSADNYPPVGLAAYHNAQAVGVMNYWTYFNTSPRVEPADIVIFDDAHLAEQPLAGLFGVLVDRRRQPDLYDQFCGLVLAHTDLYPSIALMREYAASPMTPPELLAFAHWEAIADSAANLLSHNLPENMRRFTWPRVHPHLLACGVLIGPDAIEIRPYNPPTQTLSGYRNTRQCLYLSATLDTVENFLHGRELTTYRLRGGGDDGALEQWSGDPQGHLVTAGRYDGLDFAGDLCRTLV